MYCHPSYGPTFGGNPDVSVANGANGNASKSSTNLGSTYQLPAGQSATTFFTACYFHLSFTLRVY